jgi:hypothetical protein
MNMDENDLMTLLLALGAPLLVFIGGLVSWLLKTRKEDLRMIEEGALEKRAEIYNTLLDPIIVIFSGPSDEEVKEQALQELVSIDYKKAGFNLITFGSDDMVNAYNDMMQSFYNEEHATNPKESMRKFATFLLSVRKDLYNKNTKLKQWDMLKFMMPDIDEFID